MGKEEGWSIDVVILEPCGLSLAYYRGKSQLFYVVTNLRDLRIEDCNLLSNKFITVEQLKTDLEPLIKNLKVI